MMKIPAVSKVYVNAAEHVFAVFASLFVAATARLHPHPITIMGLLALALDHIHPHLLITVGHLTLVLDRDLHRAVGNRLKPP